MENKKVKKQVRKTKGTKGKIVPLHTKRKQVEKTAPTIGAGLPEPKRKTGIGILGDAPWGTHFCLFYHTRQDLIDILVPYFKAGLENNEFCMWVTSEPLNSEDAKRSLSRAVKDLDGNIKKGQIEILDYSDWYTKTGEFEADTVLQGWVQKHDQAIKNGFDGLRATGNTLWLEKKDWEKFADYEAVVNSIIGKYKMLAICTYSLERCGASEILDVEHNHQFSLIKWKGDWKIPESSSSNQLKAKLAEQTMISEALEHSKKEWVETFNAISDWVVLINLEGRILRTNRIGEEFTGVPLDEIAGQSCCRLVHGSDRHIPGCPLLKMLETGQRASAELQVPDTDQWVMVTTDPVTDEEGKIIGAVHITRDITKRKEVEQDVDKLAKFPSENPYPVVRIAADGTILYANPASNTLLAERKSGAGQLCPNDWRGMVSDVLKSGLVKRIEVRHKGLTFAFRIVPVQEANYVNFYGVDITERKKAEERLLEYQGQLKQLASQLTLAEERERHRIASGLHDQISQSLASSKIELDALRHRVSPKDPDKALKEVSDSIGKAINDMRSLTFDLSYPILYELGFEAAVATWLAEQVEGKYGIKTEFKGDRQPKPLDENVRIFLFRDVRELLVNVVKHAQAKKVKVSIRRVGRQIQVSVEDDGVGFEPKKVTATAVRKGGFGLFSIRERLKQLGGEVEIESAPGHGCKVTITAPLKGSKVNGGQ